MRFTKSLFFRKLYSIVGVSLVVLSFYLCSLLVPVGWLTYVLSIPPCFVILVTAIARLNDMNSSNTTKGCNVRRTGMVLSAVFAVGQVVAPAFYGAMEDWPTWRMLTGLYGFALVWMTTPYLPPWSKYIMGEGLNKDKYKHGS